ncbi:unnamed protein product [Bemisia tabaci]|uniref:Anaphase-promoting complex subunit 5 n=1 Tax=Bemisia tabaci TaxID=7038 RepID=A0A9P0F5Y7_BEMTA|nr:PREDICTED: anaphase-promoting complex subunit 5 isoform X1 [Bemisia tabaci]XP_018916230.1 PREDICTED: anaphase-promoting complex subunit 5 isoform X2 [Bemisia tabaci]CAH0393703.1 unnamed protein product [Bemisia tabaci]
MSGKEYESASVLKNESAFEYLTPHKLSVALLIQDYCVNNRSDGSLSIHQRRDFCMLILRLIQCPDMSFEELVNEIQNGKFKPEPELVKSFIDQVSIILDEDVGHLIEVINSMGGLMLDHDTVGPLVNKSSPVGVFLRRVLLCFDKLTFSQTLRIYQSYKIHCANIKTIKEASPSLKSVKDEVTEIKSRTTERLTEETRLLKQTTSDISIDMSTEMTDSMNATPSCAFDKTQSKLADMSEASLATPISIVPKKIETSPITSKLQKTINAANGKNFPIPPDVTKLWSRRQAEFFIAQQTALLQNNELKALPPSELQQKIREILKANSEHAEAHYLSYLNCLRVKELTGALDSLFHYFDRSASMQQEDEKSKGIRYAALNLAILHAQFNRKNEALCALKEAIKLSHEANDNVCLQHAQAWLYKLTDENKEVLIERSISKSSDLGLNYLTSLGLQAYARFAAMTGGKPALVLEVLMRSDILNCQFSMIDLIVCSFTHKSALWNLYGKTEMASLCSQILLHLDTTDPVQGMSTYNGEGTCLAVCNIVNRFTIQGEYKLAKLVLEYVKDQFSNKQWWIESEQILLFTHALYEGRWQDAEAAVNRLLSVNKYESHLRLAELLIAKSDFVGAQKAAHQVLDSTEVSCPALRVRALILAARAIQVARIPILTIALSMANYHYLDLLSAQVSMELASIQLRMNLPAQTYKLVDHSLLTILSHGSEYEIGNALLLSAKSRVAVVAHLNNQQSRHKIIAEVIELLNRVKASFKAVNAVFKLKETVHLQALLCNEIGLIPERNRCALEFKLLDGETPSTNINSSSVTIH